MAHSSVVCNCYIVNAPPTTLGNTRTLVASVGTSPLPIVLSVRTIVPQRLILVHSTATRAVAVRLVSVLSDLGQFDIELVDCGEGTSFADTYRSLTAASGVPSSLRSLLDGIPYLLDYTGGTSVMVATAVAVHIEDHHGDIPNLRFYVDDTTGVLVSDAGVSYPISADITIGDNAALHGFTVDGCFAPPGYSPPTDSEVAPARSEIEARATRGEDEDGVQDIPCVRNALARQFTVVAPGEQPVHSAELVAERLEKDRTAAGYALELITCAALLHGTWDEVALDVTIGYPIAADGAPKGPVAQFDAIVRRGHRIVTIEVKSSQKHLFEKAGSRLAASALVFGGATRVLSVSGEAVASEHTAHQSWAPILADLVHWDIHHLDIADNSSDAGEKLDKILRVLSRSDSQARKFDWDELARNVERLQRARRPGPPRSLGQPSADTSPSWNELLASHPPAYIATALGNSPLAVSRALSLGIKQKLVGTTSALNAYNSFAPEQAQTVSLGEILSFETVRSTLHTALSTGADPAALVITPSTKSTTSAMVSLAAATHHDLVHVDALRDTVQSWRHGSGTHRSTELWATLSDPAYGSFDHDVPHGDWLTVYNDRISGTNNPSRRPSADLLITACQTVRDASPGSRVVYSPQPAAQWWSPALLLGGRRLLAIVPVAGVGKNAPWDIAAARQMLYAVDQHVNRLAGDVGALLVLLPTEENRDDRTAERLAVDTRLLRKTPQPWIGYWSPTEPDKPIIAKTTLEEIAAFLQT